MSRLDRFFDEEIKAIATDSIIVARTAAEELYDSVQRDIRRNFNNPSNAFSKGITIYEFSEAVYVRLSPILSSHAQSTSFKGNPNLWILLPDGAKRGFKRIGTRGFSWDTLRRRYGSRLSFVPVADGHVVLFRDRGQTLAIYKIQEQVQTQQRIRFNEKAFEIADRKGLSYDNTDNRGIGFK